jgi:hypothetical protein
VPATGPARAQQRWGGEHGSEDAQLTEELEAVESGPVLDDPTIVQTAKRDAPQSDGSPAVRAGQPPAAGNTVALGNLVDDLEPQTVKQFAIQLSRLTDASSPWYSELAK